MSAQKKDITVNGAIRLLLVLINAAILKVAFIKNENFYWALIIMLPLLIVAHYNLWISTQSLKCKQGKTSFGPI